MKAKRTVPASVADALDEAHSLLKRINAGLWTPEYRALANVVAKAYHASLECRVVHAEDECEFCLGSKGGVPGNENRIAGHLVCDDCHSLLITIDASKGK